MTWRINEIETLDLPVAGGVIERYSLCLDGDTSLLLQIHRIKDLCRHFAVGQSTTDLDKSIRKRRLAVIDMSDD